MLLAPWSSLLLVANYHLLILSSWACFMQSGLDNSGEKRTRVRRPCFCNWQPDNVGLERWEPMLLLRDSPEIVNICSMNSGTQGLVTTSDIQSTSVMYPGAARYPTCQSPRPSKADANGPEFRFKLCFRRCNCPSNLCMLPRDVRTEKLFAI